MSIKFILFYILPFLSLSVQAQVQKEKTLDPYGYVTKYDTLFNGIGPKVYILPLPRTLAEEMTDIYKEIAHFQDSIDQGLQYFRLFSTFKKTRNYAHIADMVEKNRTAQEYIPLLQQYSSQNTLSYALYNEQAAQYVVEQNYQSAAEALYAALSRAQAQNQAEDVAIIQSNLASLYLLQGRYHEAADLEKNYLKYAEGKKDLAAQAASHTRIALIQAYDKDFRAAENTIIRKALPLFNKSKYYSGKIDGWIILAEIYRNQNKHTEAQWFLIQAKDLANEKNYNEKLPMIEYMLGSSKMIQSNYRVAKQELEKAWDLAESSPNKYLQLAIAEQLGRAHVNLNNFVEAENYLHKYWNLRKDLF